MRDIKEPTNYSKRVVHELPGVVAVLIVSGYSKGDIPCIGLRVPFVYHLAFLCKSCRKKKRTSFQKITLDLYGSKTEIKKIQDKFFRVTITYLKENSKLKDKFLTQK